MMPEWEQAVRQDGDEGRFYSKTAADFVEGPWFRGAGSSFAVLTCCDSPGIDLSGRLW